MTKWIAVIVVIGAAGVGCSATKTDTQTTSSDGFALAQHDARTIDATLRSGGAFVHYTAVESAPSTVDVTYDFGAPVVAFHIDYAKGIGDFIPAGGTLDAAQLRLMDGLLDVLSTTVIPEDEGARSLVETASLRQTSFMQIVPVGEALTQFTFVSERGWVNISCNCGNQYIGAGYYRTAGKGCSCTGGSGNGCKGRCGQGCGITSTPKCVGTTAYTQDCGRHDYGLASFATASDDYAFAPNNCSCSGTGTCY